MIQPEAQRAAVARFVAAGSVLLDPDAVDGAMVRLVVAWSREPHSGKTNAALRSTPPQAIGSAIPSGERSRRRAAPPSPSPPTAAPASWRRSSNPWSRRPLGGSQRHQEPVVRFWQCAPPERFCAGKGGVDVLLPFEIRVRGRVNWAESGRRGNGGKLAKEQAHAITAARFLASVRSA